MRSAPVLTVHSRISRASRSIGGTPRRSGRSRFFRFALGFVLLANFFQDELVLLAGILVQKARLGAAGAFPLRIGWVAQMPKFALFK